IDKLSLTALEATLKLYLHPETLSQELPVLRMITMSKEVVFERAQRMVDGLARIPGVRAELWEETSQLGGGSLPGHDLATVCAAFRSEGVGPDEILRRLRVSEPCIFARAKKDHVLFDPRTLLDGEDAEVVAAVERALA
ncbi:MAG: L-seryl-tRNA(Sec) selenium transferase, partial [Planctomycetota bacterium]